MSPPAALGARAAEVCAWRGAALEARGDRLAEEVPVALVVEGLSLAVMLATPGDLEDFALGFAWTEGWLERPDELRAAEAVPVDGGVELRLELAAGCAWRLRERRRTLAGRTGCGLCGVDSLAQVKRALPPVEALSLPRAALARAAAALHAHQPLQAQTGATHAAAWCARDGELRLLREDVGRHNALDKVIGALLRQGADRRDGFVLVTSRASFEMVQKTAAAGIGALVAVSAPTAMAVQTARELGLALAGFVRGGDGVAYTFPERFAGPDDGR